MQSSELPVQQDEQQPTSGNRPVKPKKEKTVARQTNELSPMEELEQLERRREELRTQVRETAESDLRGALERFNSLNLGTTYELRALGLPAAARRAIGPAEGGSRKGTRGLRDAPCDICGFKTSPLHDKRAHRSQPADAKRPFSAEELTAKGMVKV